MTTLYKHLTALLLALCLLTSAMAQDKIAQLSFGWSRPPHVVPGGNNTVLKHGGLSECARHYGKLLRDDGFTRVKAKSIGGIWTLYWYDPELTPKQNRARMVEEYGVPKLSVSEYRINHWLLAEQLGLPWADRQELRLFHDLLMADYGMREVQYYFGPVAEVSPALQKLSIEPFVDLKNVGLVFDHTFLPAEIEGAIEMFKWVKRRNPSAKIYIEPRMHPDVPLKYRKYVDGTMATDQYDAAHPEELAYSVKHWGETIQTVDDEDMENATEGLTILHHDWGNGK